MLQAKEGGVVLRGGLRFFSLSVSGFTLGGAEPRPLRAQFGPFAEAGLCPARRRGFSLVKRSFYLVYHSFC